MKKHFVSFLSVCLLVCNLASLAQVKTKSYLFDPGALPREHPVDFERMRLEVGFVPEKGLVKGKITHFFSPLRQQVDSLFLDGPGITVKEAKLNGKAINFITYPAGITFLFPKSLSWGEKDSLSIVYEAYPRRGIYFIGWNDPNNLSHKQIWTQGEGTDNRYWFPCYDTPNDKLITEVYVTFASEYKVLSNGTKLAEKDNKNGTRTWHYKMSHPHTTYLVMLGIGKYEIKESKSKSGVPLHMWYYPELKNRADLTYQYSEKVFDYLESEIGVPYAWESYSQIPVQDFMFGAMENTTATLFGDFFQVDSRSYNDRNYVAVNAHELAHQWFGDLVSAPTGNNQWLQESFATHYNLICERECFGQEHFDWGRRQACNAAIGTADKKPIAHTEAATSLIYQKGSQVLEMLKYVVGREAYNKSIKRYLLEHKYANVDSDDLMKAFNEELGMELNWFWDEWVYRGGEPIYKVVAEDNTQEGNKRFTQFTVTQTQGVTAVMDLFKMPITFEVWYTDGTHESKMEWIQKETEVIKIPNSGNKKIDFVLFDPNSRVMKTVNFERSFEMLKAQALSAPNMIDRYDAVLAMKNFPVDQKRSVLEEVYNKNTHFGIKVEAVSQLMEDKNEASLALIKKAVHDADVLVRKGMISNINVIPPSLESDYATLLLDSSYQTITMALEKMCFNFPANTQKYLDKTKGIEGTIGRNVITKWLELSAANSNNDKKYIDPLVTYTSDSYEFLTRGNAMAGLRKINYFDATVLENCLAASLSSNGRLAGPAAETIKYFYAQDKYKKMIADAINGKTWKDWEKDIVMKLMM
jgi:aminopeptidase N